MGIFKNRFFIKVLHWEYWPFGVIQLPLLFMWLWYSLRERSFFYFSASNPGILSGGMMGESKSEVLALVPDDVKPKTILIAKRATPDTAMGQIQTAGLKFPLIFKPDLGERGWMVRRIDSRDALTQYLNETKIDFIAQELVTLPLEFGVYYVRFPSEDKGFVNSITAKEFLFVEGDGKKNLADLIRGNSRALLQWSTLELKYKDRLDEILPAGKQEELVSIGNHCLGTKFINGNKLITPRLSESFDRISRKVPGFFFGRYDLRCASVQDLENGKVMIVELNGCGAEPSHIYDPSASFWRGMLDLITHWQNLYRISKENHQRGVPYLSFREGRMIYQKFRALQA